MTSTTGVAEGVGALAMRCVADAEALRALTHQELLDRYRAAPAPPGVAALDGDPAGLGLGSAVLARKHRSTGFCAAARDGLTSAGTETAFGPSRPGTALDSTG
jgi:hypothetical protein